MQANKQIDTALVGKYSYSRYLNLFRKILKFISIFHMAKQPSVKPKAEIMFDDGLFPDIYSIVYLNLL